MQAFASVPHHGCSRLRRALSCYRALRQWYKFAADRLPVLQSTAAAVATEHGRDLSRAEVTQIFRQTQTHGRPTRDIAGEYSTEQFLLDASHGNWVRGQCVWRLRASTKDIPCTDILCLPEQCYRACCQQCCRACRGASCDGADARSPRKNTIEQATATVRAIT